MSDSGSKPYALRNRMSTNTRTHSGSEAIRKRVAQLMQATTTGSTNRPSVSDRERTHSRSTPSPHRNLSRDRTHRTSIKDKPLPVTPGQPRALKRKKSSGLAAAASDRPENRVPSSYIVPGPSTSKQTSVRVFEAMAHPPILDHDLSPSPSLSHKNTRIVSKRAIQDIYTHVDEASFERRRHDGFRGSLAAAEYERMKKEIETLKEALQDSRKTSKRNQKAKLDEMKSELNAAASIIKDRESELANYKQQQKKSEEILSNIEASVVCQICMDLPDQPFAISPCGHVLCLLCLQEWFRKAPPTSDDMDIDPDELTDPQYILTRSKSCPTCRAAVKRRPIPVFMVKAVASTLKKSKHQAASDAATDSAADQGRQIETNDPWKGIFPVSEESESEEQDSDDDYVVYDSDVFEDRVLNLSYHRLRQLNVTGSIFANMNSSDSEEHDDDDESGEGEDQGDDDESCEEEDQDDGDHSTDENIYVLPRWEPPAVEIHPGDRRLREGGADALKLLQRGCNLGMIRNFSVSYSHHTGIVVSLPSLDYLHSLASDSDDSDVELAHTDGMSRVFLGWNIFLSGYDVDGEVYLREVLQDIKDRPSRWAVSSRPGAPGAKDARRLVHMEDVEAFDTTDSEVWVDAEDF